MVIFLVGFMGSGKTFWASRLSKAMGLPWIDLDAEIESRESQSISSIFREKGETWFRQKEAETLRSVIIYRELKLNQANSPFTQIVATGGGAPCFHGNMEWMNDNGITVWLNPPVTEIAERLANEKEHRPLLNDLDEKRLLEFVSAKISERQEFYGQAKLEIKNTNIAVTAFVNQLIHAQKSD